MLFSDSFVDAAVLENAANREENTPAWIRVFGDGGERRGMCVRPQELLRLMPRFAMSPRTPPARRKLYERVPRPWNWKLEGGLCVRRQVEEEISRDVVVVEGVLVGAVTMVVRGRRLVYGAMDMA